MGLYDVIEDISRKNITKTESGSTRIYGVMIGEVSKNYDQEMPGRVCVTIPTRDKEANELQWARIAQMSSGKSWGHYFLPEVGDQVLLAFEGGNIERPYIIGCVPKDRDKFLTGSVDKNNKFKKLITRNGNSIIFEDGEDADSKTDKITIQTAGKEHTFILDNENKVMSLHDKDKNNAITLKTENGEMSIKVKSKITIEVGDGIKVTLNGESGAVKIEAKEFDAVTSSQIKLSADGNVKLEGANVNMSANSAFKVESNGMTSIAGQTIKIG